MRVLIWLFLFLCLPLTALFSQSRDVRKGNEHFKNEEYGEAIPYYEKALKEEDNLTTKTKLAYCYRANNKPTQAEKLYEEIIKEDKARDITYFYYAETLMSNGKYEEAKTWFGKYAELEPDDEKAPLMIKKCEEVENIHPFFEKIVLQSFSQNSEADDNSPVFWNGGIVFSSDRNSGIGFLEQKSGWTGRDFIRLYFSKEASEGNFEQASQFSSRLNEINKNTGNASFSYDSTGIFFTRNSNQLNRRNTYNLQLFSADTEGGDRWKNITILPFCSENFNYMHPAASPDGNELFFVSDKAGGEGGTDIFVVKKTRTGWGRPESLGPVINTPAHEGFPFVDANGALFFCSKGHVGYGGFDIFRSERDQNGNWTKPVNLGKPINSPLDDISIFIEKTGTRGLFTSSREGGDDDIFLFYLPDSTGNLPSAAISNRENNEELRPSEQDSSHIPAKDTADQAGIWQVPKEETFLPGQTFVLEKIKYKAEEYVVNEAIAAELDKLVLFLKKNPSVKVEIEGHTEITGDDKNNLTLSRYRAEAAAAYVRKQGIEPARVSSAGLGEEFPLNNCRIIEDCTPEKHLENQRLVVKILSN